MTYIILKHHDVDDQLNRVEEHPSLESLLASSILKTFDTDEVEEYILSHYSDFEDDEEDEEGLVIYYRDLQSFDNALYWGTECPGLPVNDVIKTVDPAVDFIVVYRESR